MLDGEEIVFTNWHQSVKSRNLARTAFTALSIDDPNPPYSYVALEGPVTVVDDPAESARRAR